MSLEVETVMAVSIMLAIFAAITTVGSCIVLGVGFERLRAGFETVRKQTGFFSDMLNRLENKVELVDNKTEQFSKSISRLEMQVDGVTEQANTFSSAIQKLAQKVDEANAEPRTEKRQPDSLERYFKDEQSIAVAAAQKAKEAERQKAIRAQLHAYADDMDHGYAHAKWSENIDYTSLRVH